METSLSMPGVSLVYSLVCVCGWIVMYNILPETEGRTLADIEMHFADKSKKFCDHKMFEPKIVDIGQDAEAQDVNVANGIKNGVSFRMNRNYHTKL